MNDSAIKSIQLLYEHSADIIYRIYDTLPFPIEIFAPDGTAVYLNQAFLELYGVTDMNLALNKYNLLNDPICNDRMGLRESIRKAFGGEAVSISDFRPPVQDLIERGHIKEKPFESAFMDVYLSPIMDDSKLRFVLCVFIIKSIYKGRPEVAKAKEYLDQHWEGDFNPRAVAKSVNISVTQLYKLFEQHTGMTPGDYHKRCKIEHIKEKLADKNLSIKEAFAACGEDSQGRIARVFKKMTGLSPMQYRDQNSEY